MIIEFVYGAVAQVGRFVGGIPAAFGWSGPSTSPLPTPAINRVVFTLAICHRQVFPGSVCTRRVFPG